MAINIAEDFSSRAESLLSAEETNFVRLVRIAGLSPKSDLAGCDFQDVDFSNCDLSGYNFSGCDLRGSYGTNIKIDKQTNFSDANVNDSVFLYLMRIDNPINSEAIDKEYSRLKKSYWASLCNWVASNINPNAADQNKEMAIRLFFDVRDMSVKTDILLRLEHIFRNSDEYRTFLINIIIRQSTDVRAIRVAVKVASSLISKDYLIYKMILAHAKVSSVDLAIFLVQALLKSTFFRKHYSEIRDIIDSFDSAILSMNWPKNDVEVHQRLVAGLRRDYLRYLNETFKVCNPDYLYERSGQYLDYARPIDAKVVRLMLSEHLRRYVAERANSLRQRVQLAARDLLELAEVEIADEILSALESFSVYDLRLIRGEYSAKDIANMRP